MATYVTRRGIFQESTAGNYVGRRGIFQDGGSGPISGTNCFTAFDASAFTAGTYEVWAYQEDNGGADTSNVYLAGTFTVSAAGGGTKAGTLSLLGVGI